MKKVKFFLVACCALCSGMHVQAETVTEDFESVTITDIDSWGYGKGLSNGWKIVGGSIYTSSGSTNYGLWSTAYNGSKKSLEASYSPTNTAFVVIPTELTGTLKFYARKTSTSSSTKGYIDLYDVEADGDSYKKSSSTAFKSYTLTTTTWTEYTVDLGEDPRLVAICLSRAAIDDVVFNTYEVADGPRLSVALDGKAAKNGSAYNFGLVGEAATVDYVVKNAGTGTLNATVATTGVYTASESTVSLEAGDSQTITITLPTTAQGSQEGTLTITPEGLDPFTVNLSGIVRDPAKLYVDFSDVPDGWTIDTGNWTIADGYAKIGYYSSYSGNGRIASPLIEIAADDVLYLRYTKNTSSTYSSAYFRIYTSVDGTDWTQFGSNYGTDAVYGEWKETTIAGLPTEAHYVAISGQYIGIDDFYGFSLSTKPVLNVAGPGTKVGTVITDNMGFVKTNTTHTFTLSNAGLGTLTADITNSLPASFTISESSISLAAGESVNLDVTFLFEENNYGRKEADITIVPADGVEGITLHMSAVAQDPETFEEDFENGIPALWTNNGFEIASNPSYGNGTKMAYAGRYSDSNTLTTPRLIAKEGDEIEIEALLPWDDETLTMEYSLDEGETWNVAFAETPANNNTLCTLSWTAPADGVYYLRFSGRYNYIDNVRGFKYAPTVLESSNLSVANNWATLCYPAEVTLSEGVQAFTAASVEDGVLTLTEVETTVPAYEPVLLYSAEGASQALPAASYVCTEIAPVKGSAGNLLVGCLHALKLNKETQYILQKQEDVVAFYRVNTAKPVTTKPYRCYLELSEPSAVKVMTFDGIFNGQDTDAISSIQSALQSGAVYDLSGRQLQKLQKGINIVNGKTILVK